MANSVDPDQTAPIGAVCSGSTLFASILNSSVMLGNYLQQTTSTDNIFRYICSWSFKKKIGWLGVPDSGTFWVCSPLTNGQDGECLSCSDQGSSVGSQHTRHTLQVKHMALSSPD